MWMLLIKHFNSLITYAVGQISLVASGLISAIALAQPWLKTKEKTKLLDKARINKKITPNTNQDQYNHMIILIHASNKCYDW